MSVAPAPAHGGRHRVTIARVVAPALAASAVAIALLIHYDVFGSASTSTSSVQGSGNPAAEARSMPPFTAVELAGSNIVNVTVGGEQSVVVHADDNLLDTITTEVKEGELVVGNTPGSYTAKSPTNVEVTVPSLDALTLTGSGIVDVSGIDAPTVHAQLPGSGVLRAQGKAAALDVDLAGSGDAELQGLVALDVHAVVGGSGRILVTAKRSLNAAVAGSGVILYGGNPPKVTTRTTGSGAVVPSS